MGKRILIINGHPNPDSLNHALMERYAAGAAQAGAEVRLLVLSDLEFDPNLRHGYQKRMELEPDLQKAWEAILWSQHLVWIHPVWWGGTPALLKGFLDRLFLPGMAFRYREGSVWWDKLLAGRSARIITTLDQPGWYYRLAYGRPSVNQLRRSTLRFCGIKPVRLTCLGPVKGASPAAREKWLSQVERMGTRLL